MMRSWNIPPNLLTGQYLTAVWGVRSLLAKKSNMPRKVGKPAHALGVWVGGYRALELTSGWGEQALQQFLSPIREASFTAYPRVQAERWGRGGRKIKEKITRYVALKGCTLCGRFLSKTA